MISLTAVKSISTSFSSPTSSLSNSINLTDCSLTSTFSATSLDSDTHLDDSCTTEDPSTAVNDSAITEDCIQQFLEEQQVAWEDATSTENSSKFGSTRPSDDL